MLDRVHHSRRRAELRRARDARHRARRKACKACYSVEIDGSVFDMMIKLGWLAEREATDKRAVEAAISAMLVKAAAE